MLETSALDLIVAGRHHCRKPSVKKKNFFFFWGRSRKRAGRI